MMVLAGHAPVMEEREVGDDATHHGEAGGFGVTGITIDASQA
jgi:hypothetical protein